MSGRPSPFTSATETATAPAPPLGTSIAVAHVEVRAGGDRHVLPDRQVAGAVADQDLELAVAAVDDRQVEPAVAVEVARGDGRAAAGERLLESGRGERAVPVAQEHVHGAGPAV